MVCSFSNTSGIRCATYMDEDHQLPVYCLQGHLSHWYMSLLLYFFICMKFIKFLIQTGKNLWLIVIEIKMISGSVYYNNSICSKWDESRGLDTSWSPHGSIDPHYNLGYEWKPVFDDMSWLVLKWCCFQVITVIKHNNYS